MQAQVEMEHGELRTSEETLEIVEEKAAVPKTHNQGGATRSEASLELADELLTYLRALDSFFQWQHHPHRDERRPDFLTRDWKPETVIASEAILRTRHLVLRLNRLQPGNEDNQELDLDAAFGGSRHKQTSLSSALFGELDEALGDANALCEGLLAAAHVSFAAWLSLGRMLSREFRRTSAFVELGRVLRERSAQKMPAALRRLAEEVAPATLSADLLHIFGAFTELLSHLHFIAPLLKADRPLKQTLPLLTLIHSDAVRLISFIEKRALRTDEIEGTLFDTLDGTAYALGMELRKVFAHELSEVTQTRHAPAIYSKIETAHGLLRDAFQQSTVTLAQALDANVQASDLFEVVRTKLEQSLALRSDIWSLLVTIREYERDPTAASVSLAELLERCHAFRHGSMQFLMYKDWEAFNLFLEELSRARGIAEALPVLHRFGTYLDTLFGQVNMRAVLSDHPFDSQSHAAP